MNSAEKLRLLRQRMQEQGMDGHLCTGVLVRHGGVAPLDKVAAHGAYKGGVVLPPQTLQHPGMAQMEGIVFTYDTNGVHDVPP